VQQLNIISMFFNAGLTVKFVMLLLLSFSFISWFIIFKKYFLFNNATQQSTEFLDDFWNKRNLAEANKMAQDMDLCPEAYIFRAGYSELQKLLAKKSSGESKESFETLMASMDNMKRTLRKAESMELAELSSTLPFLATTGSATPFIGLFGTVWGIMTSFQDIGARGSASLAVVAPGISEALVATAAGLAVAIPAVIFYNHFSNRLAVMEGNMQNFSDDLLNLVERDFLSRIREKA
jgi:biopolymer transport protein TolQ